MRNRIIGAGLVTALVAIVLFAIPLAIAIRVVFFSNAFDQLERDALRATVSIDPNFSTGDPVELPMFDPPVVASLYDTAGKLVSGVGAPTADDSARVALSGQSDQRQDAGLLVVSLPISVGEATTGAVQLTTPAADVWKRVITAWGALVLMAVVAVIVAVLVARSLARRLSRPLEELALASQELGEEVFTLKMIPSGVTEIDQVADALSATGHRLGELVARERAFAANASHQLRTPLTGLRLRLESALVDPESDARAAANDAIGLADQLEVTINDLITLARSPQSAADHTPYAITDALEHIRAKWHGPLAADGRRLRIHVDPDLERISASPPALRQILDVLVENATRHGAGTVSVVARNSVAATAIDVSDEGPGIAANVGDVFERGTSGVGGSGVGLHLARSLAESQGGRLLLTRARPGAHFTLLLRSG